MSYKANEAFYVCKECNIVRPMKEDTLWCRSCGGPIIGPLTEEEAVSAGTDTDFKNALIKANEKE